MEPPYTPSQRALQDRADTRRLADRIAERLMRDHLTDDDRAFVERLDMFFLATVDAEGKPTCSYKGGDPGFVQVIDPRTVVFPSWDGNGMFLSLGNVASTGHVGMLFMDFASPRRLRIQGRAELSDDSALLSRWEGAQIAVRVAVDAVFPNCPRYVHRMEVVERSEYVPREGCETPIPKWKRSEWARDVLPEGDPAREEK
jgi:uncharacterized protein